MMAIDMRSSSAYFHSLLGGQHIDCILQVWVVLHVKRLFLSLPITHEPVSVGAVISSINLQSVVT